LAPSRGTILLFLTHHETQDTDHYFSSVRAARVVRGNYSSLHDMKICFFVLILLILSKINFILFLQLATIHKPLTTTILLFSASDGLRSEYHVLTFSLRGNASASAGYPLLYYSRSFVADSSLGPDMQALTSINFSL